MLAECKKKMYLCRLEDEGSNDLQNVDNTAYTTRCHHSKTGSTLTLMAEKG
jgi:hypothetical protein